MKEESKEEQVLFQVGNERREQGGAGFGQGKKEVAFSPQSNEVAEPRLAENKNSTQANEVAGRPGPAEKEWENSTQPNEVAGP